MKIEKVIKNEIEILSDDLFKLTMNLKNTGGDINKNLSYLLAMKSLEGKIEALSWVIK